MGLDGLYLYSATNVTAILTAMAELQPSVVIIDSIQTVYLEDVNSSAGSVSQVRECATAFLHASKRSGIPIILVGHVTKDGAIAGPRVLEHIVDVVLFLESEGHQGHRILRGVKNRYGSTDEVAVMEMAKGFLQPVVNPSVMFLEGRDPTLDVCASVTVIMEGSIPMLLEVQALCSKANGSQAPLVRNTNGIPMTRLNLLLAVLTKVCKLKLFTQDVYVNVTAGVQVKEPSTDLAVAIAVAASYLEATIPADMVFIGEVGLGGELRGTPHVRSRIHPTLREIGQLPCDRRRHSKEHRLEHPAGRVSTSAALWAGGSALCHTGFSSPFIFDLCCLPD